MNKDWKKILTSDLSFAEYKQNVNDWSMAGWQLGWFIDIGNLRKNGAQLQNKNGPKEQTEYFTPEMNDHVRKFELLDKGRKNCIRGSGITHNLLFSFLQKQRWCWLDLKSDELQAVFFSFCKNPKRTSRNTPH